MRRNYNLSSIQVILVAISTQNTLKMAMVMLETGPKLDWTRDNQMFLNATRVWKEKVELIF